MRQGIVSSPELMMMMILMDLEILDLALEDLENLDLDLVDLIMTIFSIRHLIILKDPQQELIKKKEDRIDLQFCK